MTAASSLAQDGGDGRFYPVPWGRLPDPRMGKVGSTAQGVGPDPNTGVDRLRTWIKYPATPNVWTEVAPLKGDPGAAGPGGSLAPHVPGASYTALVNTVIVNQTIWQCAATHTATTAGSGGKTAFEIDAIAGKWVPVDADPVATFDPYLATSPQALANGANPKVIYLLCKGTGVINRFRFNVAAAAGNVLAGVQRGTYGAASTPSATQAYISAATAAVAGVQEIVASGGLVVYNGDFVIFGSDNSAATFSSAGTTGAGTLSLLFEGDSYFTQSFPPPVSAAGLSPAPYRGPLVIGRP